MFMDTNSHKEIKSIIENYTYGSHMTSLNKSASSNSRTDRSGNIVDVIGEHRLINKGDRGSVCVCVCFVRFKHIPLPNALHQDGEHTNKYERWVKLLQS